MANLGRFLANGTANFVAEKLHHAAAQPLSLNAPRTQPSVYRRCSGSFRESQVAVNLLRILTSDGPQTRVTRWFTLRYPSSRGEHLPGVSGPSQVDLDKSHNVAWCTQVAGGGPGTERPSSQGCDKDETVSRLAQTLGPAISLGPLCQGKPFPVPP
ncbi:hypothetical protein V7S43_014340 [Phytophthora oleae]|uniref:Uncharacterized protein n=1 Tax=Phytophthora oleae TaxID=2107226 RepID=A0ABD3F1A2_9STRA